MKTLIAALLLLWTVITVLLLMSTCSWAEYNRFPIPPRFDHQPTKRMILYEVSPASVMYHCRGMAYACTFTMRSYCIFYMPVGQSAFYWRHESAHCNGWAPSHPYP
jgi:hypothetical protein